MSRFVAVDDVLYFGADDGVHGQELWRSDGTEEGTYMIADINPGKGWGVGDTKARQGNLLFFRGSNTETGSELWALDTTRGPIPAVSTWSLLLMGLSILCGGVLILRKRKAARVDPLRNGPLT